MLRPELPSNYSDEQRLFLEWSLNPPPWVVIDIKSMFPNPQSVARQRFMTRSLSELQGYIRPVSTQIDYYPLAAFYLGKKIGRAAAYLQDQGVTTIGQLLQMDSDQFKQLPVPTNSMMEHVSTHLYRMKYLPHLAIFNDIESKQQSIVAVSAEREPEVIETFEHAISQYSQSIISTLSPIDADTSVKAFIAYYGLYTGIPIPKKHSGYRKYEQQAMNVILYLRQLDSVRGVRPIPESSFGHLLLGSVLFKDLMPFSDFPFDSRKLPIETVSSIYINNYLSNNPKPDGINILHANVEYVSKYDSFSRYNSPYAKLEKIVKEELSAYWPKKFGQVPKTLESSQKKPQDSLSAPQTEKHETPTVTFSQKFQEEVSKISKEGVTQPSQIFRIMLLRQPWLLKKYLEEVIRAVLARN